MPPRFYCPALADPATVTALPAEESQHLRKVLRLAVGDTVHIFDGRGREFAAQVTAIDADRAMVQPIEPVDSAPEPSTRLTLAQAVLKGDRMDAVVRDVTMMGVAEIWPVVSERTEIGLAALLRAHRVERWTRVAIASAKQAGRAVVPTVRPPRAYADMVAGASGQRFLLVEPRAASAAPPPPLRSIAKPDAALLAVGPEGGWSAGERDGAERAGFRPLTLGGRTLRAETAPTVALAVLEFLWDDL